jgi:alanine dehydrogenase
MMKRILSATLEKNNLEPKAVNTDVLNFVNDGSNILLLSSRDVKNLLSIKEAIEAVERSFMLVSQNQVVMPSKLYLDLPSCGGDFRAMPAYIEGIAGIKWVSVYPGNRDHGLPSIQAMIILNDPATGQTLAIMDGTYITTLRTGAAGAVAVKYLARKDSAVIGMVGAGAQAKMQLVAVSKVMPGIKKIKVYDVRESAREEYVNEMKRIVNCDIRAVDNLEQVADSDIVITTTPSREPVIKESYIKPGTHINAIGADAHGKQELESSLVKKSRVIVDDIEQACHSGEVNVPLSEGIIVRENICGTIGEVITGALAGRQNSREITIFDSTGLAVQDIMCAKAVYRGITGTR